MKAALLALALSAASATAAIAAPPIAPEPAKPVDAATFFAGRWYEIGRTPMSLTDGCVAGYTDYLKKGEALTQRDACRDKTPDGKEKVIGGPLKILNPGQNTKVHVSYRLFGVVPIAREYWMLDHGDGWFIQATPAMDMINLYTRDAHPSAALIAEMTARTKALGYDPAKLEFPALAAPN
ncbi:MAG TPA: lipocalin family protein [Phenylobacterium sp.]|jgi:apolipoprotein D and lipocalin family protein|nr:lipocalin family protein [Phenylobacterium sp.]